MSVKVAVRCRPFNAQEREAQARCVVAMRDNTTFVTNPGAEGSTRPYAFDHSFWSHDPTSPNFADQAQVYAALGEQVLQDAFAGFNTTVFAYGQTSSGKVSFVLGNGCHGCLVLYS